MRHAIEVILILVLLVAMFCFVELRPAGLEGAERRRITWKEVLVWAGLLAAGLAFTFVRG